MKNIKIRDIEDGDVMLISNEILIQSNSISSLSLYDSKTGSYITEWLIDEDVSSFRLNAINRLLKSINVKIVR